MPENYSIHVPENNSPGHCLATFATSITAFSIELGTFFDNQMRAKEGPYWFEDLKAFRVMNDASYHNYKNIYDFSWIVNEAFWYNDSPMRALLPKNEYDFYPTLKKLGEARNRWYHDHNPHNIGELRAALSKLKYLADKCGLELADELMPVIARVNAIAAGSYKPEPAKSDNDPEPTTKSPQPLRQAAVGAAWLGPVGVRKIQLTRAGSLIDLGAEKNVTSEMGASNRYLELWQALNLDWLWVDSLGSVAAYVQGSLRMVGYWGADPEDKSQDPFAKFLLPHSYIFADGVVCHMETLKALDHSAIGPVTKSTLKRASEAILEGDIMRLSWDGDLIHFGDNGPEYLGEVESSDWFAGHFFMPTAEA
jgi:hypothetical protein